VGAQSLINLEPGSLLDSIEQLEAFGQFMDYTFGHARVELKPSQCKENSGRSSKLGNAQNVGAATNFAQFKRESALH
jgi:hypothetical protein